MVAGVEPPIRHQLGQRSVFYVPFGEISLEPGRIIRISLRREIKDWARSFSRSLSA
jgi:hypothetical protein